MLMTLFWIVLGIYFFALICCGFYCKMLCKFKDLYIWFSIYSNVYSYMSFIADIPFVIGEFIALLLIKMGDLFNFKK